MSEEMAIVEELHDINRKLTAGIPVEYYEEMQVINRAANAITRLTDENERLEAENIAHKSVIAQMKVGTCAYCNFYERTWCAEQRDALASKSAEVQSLHDAIVIVNQGLVERVKLAEEAAAKLVTDYEEMWSDNTDLREQLRWRSWPDEKPEIGAMILWDKDYPSVYKWTADHPALFMGKDTVRSWLPIPPDTDQQDKGSDV